MYNLYAAEMVSALRTRDFHRAAQADQLAARATESREDGAGKPGWVSRLVASVRGAIPTGVEAEPTSFPRFSDYPVQH